MRAMASNRSDFADGWQVETGGSIDGSPEPAFTFRSQTAPPVPVLVASPHSGRTYPSEMLEAARDPGVLRRRLEDRYVDKIAEHVSSELGASLLVANAPRAMLDLNRSEHDVDWTMVGGVPGQKGRGVPSTRRARSGLGLVPRRLPGTGELWRKPLPLERLNARINGIHRPYHEKIASELERLRDFWGFAILFDLHSMPPIASHGSIEFVVGDRFGASCASNVSCDIENSLRSHGRNVNRNRPYSGCYVLDRHGRPREGLHAVQIEICRSIYLDSSLDRTTARMPAVAALLANALRMALSGINGIGLAAE